MAKGVRRDPIVHVTVVGSVRNKPMYEQVMHWKPYLEEMYCALGYGKVTISPTQKAIDEYEAMQKQSKVGA